MERAINQFICAQPDLNQFDQDECYDRGYTLTKPAGYSGFESIPLPSWAGR